MKRELNPMSETEFSELFTIRSFRDMADEELDFYSSLYMEQVRSFFRHKVYQGHFWCPKCESPEASIEINQSNGRAVASCPGCKMAVMIISANID